VGNIFTGWKWRKKLKKVQSNDGPFQEKEAGWKSAQRLSPAKHITPGYITAPIRPTLPSGNTVQKDPCSRT